MAWPPHLSPQYPSRLTATAPSLWQLPSCDVRPPVEDLPTAPTEVDVLCGAAELHFVGSVARHSHADLKREQQAEPTCHVAIRYIILGRPSALPHDYLLCHPSHQRPSLSDVQELARKGGLHTLDDDIVLLVGNLPPPRGSPNSVGRAACLLNNEPLRIFAPLLLRPCTIRACHSTASRHVGTTSTLRMLERLY